VAKVYSNHGDLPQLEREIDAIYEAIDRLDKGGVRGSSNVIAYGGGATAGHVHLHSALTDDEPEKHRLINDAGTSATELWSSSKINTELGGKAASSHVHAATDITSGTLAMARVSSRVKVEQVNLSIADPDASTPDEFVCGGLEYAVTITEVYAYCVGGTSVDFNLYIRDRSKAQDATGETKVFTTDAQATTTAGTKTMNNTAVAADKIVKFEITAKSGSPTWLYVFIRYQVDDS